MPRDVTRTLSGKFYSVFFINMPLTILSVRDSKEMCSFVGRDLIQKRKKKLIITVANANVAKPFRFDNRSEKGSAFNRSRLWENDNPKIILFKDVSVLAWGVFNISECYRKKAASTTQLLCWYSATCTRMDIKMIRNERIKRDTGSRLHRGHEVT